MKTTKNYFIEEDIATYEDVIKELDDGTIVVWNKHVTSESIWVETYVPTTKENIDVLLYNGKRYRRVAIYSGILDEQSTIGGKMGDIYLKAIFHECGLMVAVREHLAKGKQLDAEREQSRKAHAQEMSVKAATNNI